MRRSVTSVARVRTSGSSRSRGDRECRPSLNSPQGSASGTTQTTHDYVGGIPQSDLALYCLEFNVHYCYTVNDNCHMLPDHFVEHEALMLGRARNARFASASSAVRAGYSHCPNSCRLHTASTTSAGRKH